MLERFQLSFPSLLIFSFAAAAACGTEPGESASDTGDLDASDSSTDGSSSGASETGDTSICEADTSTDTDTSADTDTGTDTGDGVIDCAAIDDDPSTTVLSGPRAARGITFDDEGRLMGAGYEAMYRSTYDDFEVFVPGLNGFGQLDRLPGGDYVMANGEEIMRISPNGDYNVLNSNYGDYGLRVGPNGWIYSGNSDGVGRIDPDTGARELFVAIPSTEGEGARTMDFSPSLDRMYVGTHMSEVWQVALDADLVPVGEATLFVDLSQGAGCPDWDHSPGCWHDAVAVDVCGNVYVAAYGSNSLLRVSPDGAQIVNVRDNNDDSDMFGHGITWGSGQGGFAADAIYMPTPKINANPVAEVAIGVPYRTWTGTVLNGPE